MTVLNGLDVVELKEFRQIVATDATQARRDPQVTARWVGGDASRVQCGSASLDLGGEGNLNAMQALLCALVACEVDVIATHAALVGVEIADLEVTASGRFDLRSYLGLDGAPGPGYEAVTCRARLDAPGATPEQLAYLRERCERSSPVADTLARMAPVEVELTAR